jgi:hypothetical protein
VSGESRICEYPVEYQGLCFWVADIAALLQGPWHQGPCHNPMGPGLGSVQQPVLTPPMLNDYDTLSISPYLSPEDMLVNPLSSLGLEHDSFGDFGSEVMQYPQNEESQTNHEEKLECPSTMRRMRRREQNRESYVR